MITETVRKKILEKKCFDDLLIEGVNRGEAIVSQAGPFMLAVLRTTTNAANTPNTVTVYERDVQGQKVLDGDGNPIPISTHNLTGILPPEALRELNDAVDLLPLNHPAVDAMAQQLEIADDVATLQTALAGNDTALDALANLINHIGF